MKGELFLKQIMQLNGLFKYKIMVFIIMFVLPVCAADDDRLEAPEQSINMSRRGNNRVHLPIEIKVCMVCCVGGCCGCLAEFLAIQSLPSLSNGPSKNFSSGFVIGAKCTQYLLNQPTVAQKVNEVGAMVTHRVRQLLRDKTD